MRTSLSLLLKKRNRILSSLAVGVFVVTSSLNAYSQSCTATNFGTVGSAVTCLDFDATPAGAGSSAGCTGSGFGGSGTVRIIRFCTNASNQCVSFDFTGLASANGTEISLWTTCSAGALSGYVTNSINCYSGSTTVGWSTAGQATVANTCYFLRVWTKDPPTATATVCANVESPTNDFCTAPQQIGTVPATYDNYCMTAGTAGDPAAAQFCAGTLENNAWFSFTTLSTCTFPCTVTINITGINCTGGGSGFQIGYWTGACGALTNIGCTSGSGGSVTATINNLSPNQTVLVGIDGNAGAYCNFSISGTNITPLPVTFIDFSGFRKKYGVEMKWQTLSEKNNAFYSIESSRDLQNWNEIHREYVAGDTFGLKEYQFVDYNAPELDLIYYRLIQTDLNGTATILKVISLDETTYNNRMKVIPNPVNDEPTSVSIEWDYDTFGTFVVKDSQGKELLTKKASLMRGVNLVKLEMETLKSGLYMVEFSDSESKQMTKFIKL
jgi:hypothetical protein